MSRFFIRMTRIVRHLGSAIFGSAERGLPPAVRTRIQQHIAASESCHTGQIRIYAESSLPLSYLSRDASPRERAITLFGKLRVWDTECNNGVLIYLLTAEHAIEIIADRGLNPHVSHNRWQEMISHMSTPLRAGHWEDGLMRALDDVSALLELHFPSVPGSMHNNELPDAPIVR